MTKKEAFYSGKPGFSLAYPDYSWIVERDGKRIAILYDPTLLDKLLLLSVPIIVTLLS